MSYAERDEPLALIKAVAPEPIASTKKPRAKQMRFGIRGPERRRIDKQQVRLLKDALGLK